MTKKDEAVRRLYPSKITMFMNNYYEPLSSTEVSELAQPDNQTKDQAYSIPSKILYHVFKQGWTQYGDELMKAAREKAWHYLGLQLDTDEDVIKLSDLEAIRKSLEDE